MTLKGGGGGTSYGLHETVYHAVVIPFISFLFVVPVLDDDNMP